MDGYKTTRRRFLVAAMSGSAALAGASGLFVLRASTAWAQAEPGDALDSARTLSRVARLLYPHAGVGDTVYAEVVDGILAAAAGDPQLTAMLDDASAELDAARGGDFFALDEATQLEVLKALSGRPFFGAIQSQVQWRLYTDPRVWQTIGYPGPSVEFGGYLERGFDDIDWLPEEA
jgi:hypothetical protein